MPPSEVIRLGDLINGEVQQVRAELCAIAKRDGVLTVLEKAALIQSRRVINAAIDALLNDGDPPQPLVGAGPAC